MARHGAAAGTKTRRKPVDNVVDVADVSVPKTGAKRGCSTDANGSVKKRSKNDEKTDEVEAAPRSGLRPSRRAHPGLVDKPTTRRTPAEVAASNAEKKAAAAKAAQDKARKQDELAMIMARDEAAAQEEQQKTIRHRSKIAEDSGSEEETESEDEQVDKGGKKKKKVSIFFHIIEND